MLSPSARPIRDPQVVHPRPPVRDLPQDILQAWTALEVLSPAVIRSWPSLNIKGLRQVVPITERALPWDGGATSVPGKRVIFEVFLGTLVVDDAVGELPKVYADKRPERTGTKGHAILASVIVDKNGCPLEEDEAVSISSFRWR
jgi:hypothetical protein